MNRSFSDTVYGAISLGGGSVRSSVRSNVENDEVETIEDPDTDSKRKLTIDCDSTLEKQPSRKNLNLSTDKPLRISPEKPPRSPEKHPRQISSPDDPIAVKGNKYRKRISPRSMFDRWLRRDSSFSPDAAAAKSASSWGSNTPRTRNSTPTNEAVNACAEAFMGPADRSVEKMVRFSGGHGLDYRSADRELLDTASWQHRKTYLMERTRSEIGHDHGFKSDNRYDYHYDHTAVIRLETDRWRLERALILGIGFVMALTGIAVSRSADIILDRKIEASLDRFESYGFVSGLIFFVSMSSLLALGAFFPVAIRPISAGSGIAEAKATLNGVIVPNCTDLDTALCKGLSVIMAVAASLPAGLEGPMIHLGLCIGNNANRLIPRNSSAVYDPLKTDRHRIDFAAIGTAAGVAAAFRSPIAGVLFAMEEGASFWSTDLTWRCFLSACTCVISIYGIMTFITTNDTFHVTSMALFNGIEETSLVNAELPAGYTVPKFAFWEYAVIAFIGSAGGIIGGVFCTLNRSLAMMRRRLSLPYVYKGLEVLCIAAIASFFIWVLPSLPFFSACGILEDRYMNENFFRQFNCPDGQYNELASLLLNPLGARSITLLFHSDSHAFSIKTCCAAGLFHLIVLCLSFGMSVSAGIFIPLLFIGACLGRAFAIAVGLDPQTYAIVGAAATLGGVVRVLISLTAIVTHTTSLSFFITPVMIATLLARYFGNWVSGRPGIYDNILQLRGVPFLEEDCPVVGRHANIRARNVMNPKVSCITTQMPVNRLIYVLQSCACTDFPVVDNVDGVLVGRICRGNLLALLSRKDLFFKPTEEGGVENPQPLSSSELNHTRAECKGQDNAVFSNISAEDASKYLHISPYIQIAPHTFDGHGSAERAYEMFRCLGLHSLLVVDKNFRPIGIITRHELALLEEVGMHDHKIERKRTLSLSYSSHSMFE